MKACLRLQEKEVERTTDDPDEPIMRLKWTYEVSYFNELSLDRIDSLNHKAHEKEGKRLIETLQEARNLLLWNPGPADGLEKPLDFLQLPGQVQNLQIKKSLL